MQIRIIDTTTGSEPTSEVIAEIAYNNGLMVHDIDGFGINEDGQIILLDDCGNFAWVDNTRFEAEQVFEAEGSMTKEEVKIKIGELGMYARTQEWDDEYTEAVNMAIKALEQEESTEQSRIQQAREIQNSLRNASRAEQPQLNAQPPLIS